jgi:hypothetical protein
MFMDFVIGIQKKAKKTQFIGVEYGQSFCKGGVFSGVWLE